jgi:lipoprotein-anchoring transpeptidase ErfK/SrfK
MTARRRIVVCGALLAAGLAGLGIWLASSNGSAPASAAHQTAVPSTTTRPATKPTQTPAPPTASNGAAVQPETLVATLPLTGAPGSQTPGGPPTLEVPGQWLGAASILPVIAQHPGWVEVRLAQRPNESTAWVPARDVSLATDTFHLVINLATMHLELFNHGQEVGTFPAGIGVPSDPTPTGHFFVALFAQAPSAGYGPFVIVTSAHSNTISDWEESGDAITAIHGPLGADAAIGTTGARVSHGCVRLHDADLAQLRDVPAGTPIDIVG